jgi:thioredoxin 1
MVFSLEGKEDKELERIKLAKMKEMIKNSAYKEQEKPVIKPVSVTDATFEEVIQNNPLVVVDCWAPWCGPCNMVAPVIEELSRDYAGRILFGKLNVDENPQTSRQYEIMSIPTMLVFKTGKLVDKIIGAMPKQMLEQKITRYS